MKHVLLVTGIIAAMIACTAQAEIYTFESTGVIDYYGAGFDGADQYPFVGLSMGDSLFYHFEFDINAVPTYYDGFAAGFDLDGTGSYAMLGSTRIDFERIHISVGSSDGVIGGYFDIGGYVDSLGISAGIGMQGNAPMLPELPTSIDINQFNWARNAGADSDQNLVLLPIVMGTVDTAVITPAPASSLVLLAGFGICRRRRPVSASA